MRLHKGLLVSLSVLAGITLGSAGVTSAHADDNGAATANTSQTVAMEKTTSSVATTATTTDSNANQTATTNTETVAPTTDQQVAVQNNVTVSTPKASSNGWVQDDSGYWQYLQNGNPVSDGWQKINGQWYFFSGGYMEADGAYSTASTDATGTELFSNYYYFNNDGTYRTNGWIWNNLGGWQYANANGKLAYGWQQISGQWYYFAPGKGGPYMASNGVYGDNHGNWYSFDSKGRYQTNHWVNQNGSWSYANNNGILVTGWQRINGHWYYFNQGSSEIEYGMTIGEAPAAMTGWQKINGSWYYFDTNNAWALTGWQKINGHWYCFDTNNAWALTGWQKINGNWYYFDANNAWADTGWQKINGSWYYFDANNAWALTGWQKINGHWYYFDANNAWALTGWQWINGHWYYFDSTNTWMVTGTHTIDGKTYTFNNDGQMQ
ncbi:hypothetical protein [Limosilactobacillus kribbianus]|uniref:hypothetical protein n=1 Tax=Limosilactobacillus kribbianus TaxID=2982695 RepID=UPI0022641413|nr:hypothetical protein [Limosilactobacillus kribbianus]